MSANVQAKVIATRFAATVEIKGILKRFQQQKGRIEALAHDEKLEEAISLFEQATAPLIEVSQMLEGVRVERADKKFENLKLLLQRARRFTDIQRIRKDGEGDPKLTQRVLLGRLDLVEDTLKSLARVEGRIDEYKAVEKTFRHGPFEVENLYGFKPEEYQEPLKVLDAAAAEVAKAGYSSILYGKVLLRNVKGAGWAGMYQKEPDTIDLNVEAKNRFDAVFTLVHELGHRYWFKVLSAAARDAYEDAYSGTAQNLTLPQREEMWAALVATGFDPKAAKKRLPPETADVFPLYWKERTKSTGIATPQDFARNGEGAKRNFIVPRLKYYHLDGNMPTSVTDYGRTSVTEDFAEVFAHHVLGKPLTEDAKARFDATLR